MTLNKAIEHGKEHRKAYSKENGTYEKAVDPRCRNHGSCYWGLSNRLYCSLKREEGTEIDLKEYCRQEEISEGSDEINGLCKAGSYPGGQEDGPSDMASAE